MNPALSDKLDRLKVLLSGLQPGVIAFSGGVDSRLLACLADAWGLDFMLVTLAGGHMTPQEVVFARVIQGSLGLESAVLLVDPLYVPGVAANGRDRCYHCKSYLFSHLKNWACGRGRANLVEGSQASDLETFRPGRRAVADLGVQSPLQEVRMTKQEVRCILADLGLPHPDQPSRPCLLTRFAYGLKPSHEVLRRLGLAEDGLQALGLRDFRLRVIDTDRFCLQLQQREAHAYRARAGCIQTLLDQSGFGDVEVVWSDTVSGYYDA